MPKKNAVPVLLCVVLILTTIIFIMHLSETKVAAPASVAANPGLEKRTIAIGSTKLTVEVAATAAQQQQGLSDRPSLAPDAGMLFPLVDPSKDGFWMKDMKFPLDFIYFDQGRVVETKENVPTALVPLPFFPNETVDAVLEVNAGWVSSHGIKVGDASDY